MSSFLSCILFLLFCLWEAVLGIMSKRMAVVYYSGTGGSERVAKVFETSLTKVGYTVDIFRLFDNPRVILENDVSLMLVYPVHAFNAPDLVYKWVENLSVVDNIHACVVSVSGGGEMRPNTACRLGAIKRLKKKGYNVIYEKMLVMPSNIGVATKEPLAKMLLDILPKKVEDIVADIENGIIRRRKPFFFDRFASMVGKVEKYGARIFGKRIKVSDSCNGCGWCADNCPAGNIIMEAGKPTFARKCHLCLGCLYGCPSKALEPGFMKQILIKEGYDLNSLENKGAAGYEVDVEGLTKGSLWKGLRKYLSENN